MFPKLLWVALATYVSITQSQSDLLDEKDIFDENGEVDWSKLNLDAFMGEGFDPSMFGDMNGMGGGPPVFQPDLKLVKPISCDVCHKVVENAGEAVFEAVEENSANKRKNIYLGEDMILEMIEEMCEFRSPLGSWVSKFNIVGEDVKSLVENEEGRCQEDCYTIMEACSRIIGDYDVRLAELLWSYQKKPREELSQVSKKLCSKKRFCKGKDVETKNDL